MNEELKKFSFLECVTYPFETISVKFSRRFFSSKFLYRGGEWKLAFSYRDDGGERVQTREEADFPLSVDSLINDPLG